MKRAIGFCLVALAGAWLVPAQPAPEAPPAPRPPPLRGGDLPGRPAAPPGVAGGRLGPGFERVFSVLTDEQRASLRQAMEQQREKARGLEEQIREARKDLAAIGFAEKFDEAAVRQKAMAAAKLEVEMTVLRAKALSEMRPPLTAGQLEKLRNPLPPEGVEDRPLPRRGGAAPPRDENGLPPKDAPPPGKAP